MRVACTAGMGNMMSWMVFWGLVGVAVLALAVLGMVWFVRRMDGQGSDRSHPETAEEILRRRYAAGELDEDEYLRRRAGLYE